MWSRLNFITLKCTGEGGRHQKHPWKGREELAVMVVEVEQWPSATGSRQGAML